ncbi:gag/pol protein [Cucumis melo var. makuwa]|uniref:Gag/pol protein n=1 Tax=Cucumis melo var. makuwa TaxID=1194695 RepID=A0A5A7VPE8_CUCMM|nr:gag/pol protein [Cucumis melo var. makuwa]
MILVIADLHFVLMKKRPPFPTQNASQSIRDAYNRWTKANDKAHLYILASISDILSKKHEIVVTAHQIMDSLNKMFGQPSIQIKQEAIKYLYNARMKEGESVREHVLIMIVNFNVAKMNGAIEYNMTTLLKELQTFQSLKGQKEGEANVANSKRFTPSSSGSKKIQKKKGGKGKDSIAAAEGKRKAKETSSLKQLGEGEMTLNVGTGDTISARAVGDAKSHKSRSDREIDKEWTSNELEDHSLPPCESYIEGKMTKRPFIGKGYRAKEPLELIHSDLCGPMNVKARGDFEYFISFIDDYSRYGYLYLMEHESEALEKLKEYKAEVENLLTHVLVTNPKKLEPRSRLCQFGYPKATRGGLFFDPQENRVFVSINATFLEEDYMRDHKPRSKLVLNEATDESTRVVDEVGPSSRVDETTTSDDGVEDPFSYKQAMKDVDKDQWVKAMDLEFDL